MFVNANILMEYIYIYFFFERNIITRDTEKDLPTTFAISDFCSISIAIDVEISVFLKFTAGLSPATIVPVNM